MVKEGKKTILLVQPIDAIIGDQSMIIANSTENGHSTENELMDEMTKNGRVLAYGHNSESFEITAFGEKVDPGQLAIIAAIKKKKKLRVWEVDLVANEAGTYDSIFAYCFVESVEKSNGDSFQEVTATLQVEGESQEGTLTMLPAAATAQSSYDFETAGETGTPV